MGMFTECQAEMIRALKEAGCERDPFLSMKRMEASAESRISAVLCEDDQLERANGKKFFTSEEGKPMRRTRLFNRELTFSVVIGDFSQEKAEETYEGFLRSLQKGIYVDGDYVSIEPSEAQWLTDKDHILHAKVGVQIKVACRGGLYRDTDMAHVSKLDLDLQKGC